MKSVFAVLVRSLLTLTVLGGAVAATSGLLFVLNQAPDSEAGVVKDPMNLSVSAVEERKIAPLSAEPDPAQTSPAPAVRHVDAEEDAITRPKPVRIETIARKEWRDLLGGVPRGKLKHEWAKVTAVSLNVRGAPGLSAEVKGQLARNARVEVLQVKDGWSRIRQAEGDDSGWVASRYLESIDDPDLERSARKTGATVRK